LQLSWLTADGALPIFRHTPNLRRELKELTTEWAARTSSLTQEHKPIFMNACPARYFTLQLNRVALLASGEHQLGVGPKLLSGLQPLYADHQNHLAGMAVPASSSIKLAVRR